MQTRPQRLGCRFLDHDYIVMCDYANLSDIPQFTSSVIHNVRHLSLKGNNIASINASHMQIYPHLQIIDLRAQRVRVNCSLLERMGQFVYILTDCGSELDLSMPLLPYTAPVTNVTVTGTYTTTNNNNNNNNNNNKQCLVACLATCWTCLWGCTGLRRGRQGKYSPGHTERTNEQPNKPAQLQLDTETDGYFTTDL